MATTHCSHAAQFTPIPLEILSEGFLYQAFSHLMLGSFIYDKHGARSCPHDSVISNPTNSPICKLPNSVVFVDIVKVIKTVDRIMYPCLCLCHRLCLLVSHAVSPRPSDQLSERTHVYDTSTVLWRRWNKESHTHSPTGRVTMSLIVVMPENVRCFVRALCLFTLFSHFCLFVTIWQLGAWKYEADFWLIEVCAGRGVGWPRIHSLQTFFPSPFSSHLLCYFHISWKLFHV